MTFAQWLGRFDEAHVYLDWIPSSGSDGSPVPMLTVSLLAGGVLYKCCASCHPSCYVSPFEVMVDSVVVQIREAT